MEIVALVRLLWDRRLLVGLGVVVASAIGFAIGGSPPSSAGLAWSRLALDTPDSQLIDPAPGGAETLPWRAGLLIHLTASAPVQRRLAQALGVPEDELFVVDPALGVPEVPASLPKAAAEAAAISPAPYVLSVYRSNDALPLISIEAAAPDRDAAVRLVRAAEVVFKSQASPGGGKKRQAFVVEEAAPVRATTLVSGQGRMKAAAVALVVFSAWCTCLVLLPALVGSRRPPRRLQPT